MALGAQEALVHTCHSEAGAAAWSSINWSSMVEGRKVSTAQRRVEEGSGGVEAASLAVAAATELLIVISLKED